MQIPEGPVIVCGLGSMGWPALKYLRALEWPVVAIDMECVPDDPRLQGVQLIRGNYREQAVLEKAGIHSARGVILLANDDLNNLAATLEMRRLNSTVRIVVRLFNENLVAKLGKTVNNVIALSSARLAGPLIATTAVSGDVLARFCSFQQEWQIEQVTIDEESPLIGLTSESIQEKYAGIALLNSITAGSTCAKGDTLLAAGPVPALTQLREAAGGDEGLSAKWAGRIKRLIRTIYNTIIEIEWPVKVAAYTFFAVVLAGSVICWLSGLADTLPRGLFRTLNIMVTSADLREQDYPAPWQHVFISFLKLAGLLLTAAFTALLTNYLVRMRLRGVLSISRVPESGHIVLCGLGTVGLRVLESLRQQNVPVVVLEKLEGGRFNASARQLGATVIMGDGTLPATLNRANTSTARALVVATSSDLANVEIAIMAREQNPDLRVIIRLDDAALADAMQMAANIGYAIGLPRLIAPAFVLPLFGDRFLSLFWMKQRLHVAMEIIVQHETYGLLGLSKEQAEKFLDCHLIVPGEANPPLLTDGQGLLMIVVAQRVSEVLKRCYEQRPLQHAGVT